MATRAEELARRGVGSATRVAPIRAAQLAVHDDVRRVLQEGPVLGVLAEVATGATGFARISDRLLDGVMLAR